MKKKLFPACPDRGKMPIPQKIGPGLCILCMLFFLGISAGAFAQQNKLTYSWEKVKLPDVLKTLEKADVYKFIFNYGDVNYMISATVKDKTVTEILDIILKDKPLTYSRDGIYLMIRPKITQPSLRKYTLKGQVTDQKGVPMPGVTIRLGNTAVGTATDNDGNFTLAVSEEQGSLTFSFVGFESATVPYVAGKPLKIKLKETTSNLDEVQVIAYGEQKKRTVISAISSVKADDIKELPTHSLESLLQGHMAGVEVNNMSGSPGGGGAVVAIRGYNSFFVEGEGADKNYGTPLYVVDGVPMQAFTSPITGTNTLSDIDPSMIESIEVLKDAASAAIYGSRAGNGVILITTKKGRAGQAKFTANVSYSASWLPKTPVQTGGQAERRYHMMGLRNTIAPYLDKDGHWKMPTSVDQVYQFGSDGYEPEYDYFRGNASHANNAYPLQDSLNEFYNNSTDWWRYAYRVANVWNANLQASGGSEKFRYMIGAGYYKEQGIMYSSDYQRMNVMTNLMAQPAKRLRIENQISLSYTDRSRGGSEAGSGQKVEGMTVNPMRESSLLPGADYIKDVMLGKLNSVTEKNHGYAARYNLVLNYEIIRNLNLRITGGLDYNQQNQNNFHPSTMDSKNHWSRSTGSIGRNLSIQNENLLSYNFKIHQNHNFDILLGLSFMKDQSYVNKGSGTNGPNDHVQYVGEGWGSSGGLLQYGDMTGSAFTYESDFEEERMNSYFGRLRYNFQEKYMLEATVRRDGSSVFGSNVRWATFPSVAVGWAFSEESFFQPLYWLSFGKIRASWGKSGQKFGQRYLAEGMLMSGGSFMGKGSTMPDITGGLLNRNLTWQETNQYDIGLDVSLLDYRLKFTLDYYYRYTKGQLQKIQLPGNFYYQDFQWQNALEVSNEGLELELTADIFRETAVTWRLKVNASRNWNRFEKSSDGFDFGTAVIGKPLYQIRAYKTMGYYDSFKDVPVSYQANGAPRPLVAGNISGAFFGGTRRIADLNGDGIILSSDDQYYAASPLPQAYGGIISEIRWKQLDLNVVFNYSIGRHILKVYDDSAMRPGPGGNPVMVDLDKVHTWQGAGDNGADYPRIQVYDRNTAQFDGEYDCDIEKVHMLRLKQLTLGYNLHERLAKKIGIEGARIFLTGENVFLLTNYSGLDPEIVDITSGKDYMGGYPLPRKFTVGLTLNF